MKGLFNKGKSNDLLFDQSPHIEIRPKPIGALLSYSMATATAMRTTHRTASVKSATRIPAMKSSVAACIVSTSKIAVVASIRSPSLAMIGIGIRTNRAWIILDA